MTGHQRRKERVGAMWTAAWNDGALDGMDAVLARTYVRHLTGSDQTMSLDGFKQVIVDVREGFPDIETSIEDIVCEGERVAIRWWCRGTHLGLYHDVPPTGRLVTVAGATFARFEDDMMTESWSTWSPRDMLTALGIIPLGSRS
jgi:steroid delta-isomerase-like uncharacterized protein